MAQSSLAALTQELALLVAKMNETIIKEAHSRPSLLCRHIVSLITIALHYWPLASSIWLVVVIAASAAGKVDSKTLQPTKSEFKKDNPKRAEKRAMNDTCLPVFKYFKPQRKSKVLVHGFGDNAADSLMFPILRDGRGMGIILPSRGIRLDNLRVVGMDQNKKYCTCLIFDSCNLETCSSKEIREKSTTKNLNLKYEGNLKLKKGELELKSKFNSIDSS
ncbi:hypothetical protein J6590_060000 [Homalodisca vitripennis]|nr:hypothetical protein J6590_060000 [Homalodisca vitripennis]